MHQYESAVTLGATVYKNEGMRKFLASFFVLCLSTATLAEDVAMTLPSGESLNYARYSAKGNDLLLWFASERGLGPAEIQAARDLAARGTEVWQFDITSAFFLPQTNSSMDKISGSDMRAILDLARKAGRGLTVYSVNRAAVPVLKGLAGQHDGRTQVLLMHPHTYSKVDTFAGADYLSFGNLGSVDVLILQPRRSAATPWAEDQLKALRKDGANAQLLILDGVRERYWVRESATDFEVAEGKRLAERINEWRKRLK